MRGGLCNCEKDSHNKWQAANHGCSRDGVGSGVAADPRAGDVDPWCEDVDRRAKVGEGGPGVCDGRSPDSDSGRCTSGTVVGSVLVLITRGDL